MIVIIDSDVLVLQILKKAFCHLPIPTKTFKKGGDALRFMQKNKVSLLIFDPILPDMNGLEILKKIRGTPSFILTHLSSEKEILKGYNMGATDYITKPFSLQILLTKTLAILNGNLSPS